MSKKDKKAKEEEEDSNRKSYKKIAKKLKKKKDSMNIDEIISDEILKNVKVPTENQIFPPPPPFLMNIIQNIQQKMGVHFENVNVRVVGEDDLDTLPNEMLNQILENAVTNESFELATKIRDIVNKRKENGK
jgi:hypothetical protein